MPTSESMLCTVLSINEETCFLKMLASTLLITEDSEIGGSYLELFGYLN